MSYLALSILTDASIYFGVVFGLWVSFRVLGYPDLSVEHLFVLGGALLGISLQQDMGPYICTGLIIISSVILGFTISGLVNWIRIHPIIATLAAGYVYYSLVLAILHGPNIFLGKEIPDIIGQLMIPLSVSLCIFFALIATLATKTEIGKRIIATGSSPDLSKKHGISVFYYHGLGLSFSFLCVMCSGALFALKVKSVDIGQGSGLLLLAIGVVIIGRVLSKRIKPFNNALYLFVCVIIYLIILQTVLYFGLPSYWVKALTGFGLLVTIALLPRSDLTKFKI